jgi:hypothetical protein
MIKNSILLFLCLFNSIWLFTQNHIKDAIILLDLEYNNEVAFSSNLNENISATVSFSNNSKLRYKTCKNNICTAWLKIEKDIHIQEQNEINKVLLFLNNQDDKIIFKDDANLNSEIGVEFNHFKYAKDAGFTNINNRSCTCDSIQYKNRKQWNCPDTEQSSTFTPTYTKHSHIVVHHQAGFANPPYENTVAAIWDFHVNSNGWSDIGYNWLIAPDGTIFKGRSWLNGDQNVLGAHTCGCNSNKLGICLLGNFTNELPSTAQYESLKKFIVWKACELDFMPDKANKIVSKKSGDCIDEIVNTITGHRDNCGPNYTSCPGDKFYAVFEKLRTDAIADYYKCADTLGTSTKEAIVEKYKIYPNPSLGTFQINNPSNDKIDVAIYSLLGQKLLQYQYLSPSEPIETKLEAGTYVVKMEVNGAVYSQNLFIVK